MRRSVASLLLAISLAGFTLPLVQAQTAAPACCRRTGQHHCTAPATPDGFRSLTPCCPFAHLQALNSHGNSALGTASTTVFAPVLRPRVPGVAVAPVPQVLASDNLQRGPPLA